MLHPIISETVYRPVPTGGVITPKVTQVIMIMPKTTGSTPTFCITGSRIGVRISAITVFSINMPHSSRNRITRNSSSVLLVVMETSALAIVVVKSSNTTP